MFRPVYTFAAAGAGERERERLSIVMCCNALQFVYIEDASAGLSRELQTFALRVPAAADFTAAI